YGTQHTIPFAIEPLWPVGFITAATLPISASAIGIFYMIASILMILWPHIRLARIVLCVSLIMAISLKYSFCTLNHKEHMWIWASLLLVFIPSQPLAAILASRNHSVQLLDIFSAIQGIILLFYSLTGLWKLAYGIAGLLTNIGI